MDDTIIFDFGFTAKAQDEISEINQIDMQALKKEHAVELAELQDRLDVLYNSVLPLLANLKANPEKDYIHWPNRVPVIEQFEEQMTKVYTGKTEETA